MKKIVKSLVSLILVSVLIFPVSLISFGKEEDYSELIKEKYEYFLSKQNESSEFVDAYRKSVNQELLDTRVYSDCFFQFDATPYISYQAVGTIDYSIRRGLSVIMYTDIAKDLTLNIYQYKDGQVINKDDHYRHDEWMYIFTNVYFGGPDDLIYPTGISVQSPEINEILGDWFGASVYALREVIKHYGITKEELKSAYELSQTNPDHIRQYLSELTDDEYERLKGSDGKFISGIPDDFVLEALCVEDDYVARNILLKPSCLYVPEIDQALTYHCIVEYWSPETGKIPDWDEVDLTSDFVGIYLAIVHNFYYLEEVRGDAKMWSDIMEARTKQLAKAPETGEELILIPTAIASLSLGIYAIASKKFKRIKL